MYTVALFKNKEGDYYTYYDNGKDPILTQVRLKEQEYLECLGYKLVSCIITTSNTLSLKVRLKFRIQELRALKPEVNYYGYDETLVSQIGLLTSRLLRRGVEITNEVALQCYDIRNSKTV